MKKLVSEIKTAVTDDMIKSYLTGVFVGCGFTVFGFLISKLV